MDIQLFQTFLLVAKLGNITQAAEQLNFTQPAVTTQIRALEDHYGISLFERIGKKLYITEAGRELILHVENLMTVYHSIDTAMQRFSGLNKPIRIGASTTVASYILSPILLDFQNDRTTDSVIVDICADLPITIKGLLDNSYDMAVVHSEINNNQIIQFNLFHEKLVWIANRALVAASRNCQDIRQYPFINFHPGCVYRTQFEEVIHEKDVHSIIEYSDAEAIKRAVLDGMGASVLPYVLVESYLADGTLVEFTNVPQLTFNISVAFHKHKVLTPAMKDLLLIFAEHAEIKNGLKKYLSTSS